MTDRRYQPQHFHFVGRLPPGSITQTAREESMATPTPNQNPNPNPLADDAPELAAMIAALLTKAGAPPTAFTFPELCSQLVAFINDKAAELGCEATLPAISDALSKTMASRVALSKHAIAGLKPHELERCRKQGIDPELYAIKKRELAAQKRA